MASTNDASRTVFLGLGSNVGDRPAHLAEAKRRIQSQGLEILKESSLYETEPVGYAAQPWFLNQVIEVGTTPLNLSDAFPDLAMAPMRLPGEDVLDFLTFDAEIHPHDYPLFWVDVLLKFLKSIETEMGRRGGPPNGPRVIDIDILIYGNVLSFGPMSAGGSGAGRGSAALTDLVLPHPRLHLRRFVLTPLCEIAPDLVHPLLNKTCRELLDELADTSIVRRV